MRHNSTTQTFFVFVVKASPKPELWGLNKATVYFVILSYSTYFIFCLRLLCQL